MKGFLTGRRQRVVVGGKESSWGEVLSGVPQGSVLGPCLFLIFINDLPHVVQSNISLFADDTKLYVKANVEAFTRQLQDDLSKLDAWSNQWQLRFNPEMCAVFRLADKVLYEKGCRECFSS